MRKENGDLHFYINGLDQGVAATRVPAQLWGAVDLYGMTAKVLRWLHSFIVDVKIKIINGFSTSRLQGATSNDGRPGKIY